MMDFRLDPSMGWQALLILCAVMSPSQCQFPPMYNQGEGSMPMLDNEPVEIVATAGTTVTLPCLIRNSGASGATWMLGDFTTIIAEGKTVRHEEQRFSVDTSFKDEWNLVIKNVRSKDANTYQCMANVIPPQIKVVTLTVKAKPSIDTSSLSAKYTVEEGYGLEVQCKASGFPEPEVEWFKYVIDPSSNMEKKELISSTNVLSIPSLSRGMSNIYACTAKNDVGHDMYEIFVDIIYKPDITTEATHVSVQKQDSVTLSCIVDSNPTAKTTWYKNTTLHTSWKYFVTSVDYSWSEIQRVEQITIRQVDLDDSGEYICQASNKVGRAQLPIHVTVIDASTTSTQKTTTKSISLDETSAATTTITEVISKKQSTPLSIEEPRTGGSTGGEPPCRQYNTHLIVSLVLIVTFALLLS